MRVFHDSEERWLADRLDGITASDAAVIMGAAKWGSKLGLYAQKLGLSDPVERTEEMAWGLRLEQVLMEAYQEETGHTVTKTPKWCIDIRECLRWQKASLDADLVVDGVLGILETKTTSERNAGEWDNGVPKYHQCQVQHQMAVTGRPFAVVAVLIGGQKMLHARVDRDDAFIQAMTDAEEKFWGQIIRNQPPSVDPGAENAKTLAQVFHNPSEVVVPLPMDLLTADERLVEVKAQLAALDTEKDALENRLRIAIGDHMGGLLPSGVKYTWKPFEKKEYVVKAQKGRMLRRVEAK